jgi:hypothetical protein
MYASLCAGGYFVLVAIFSPGMYVGGNLSPGMYARGNFQIMHGQE